MIRLKDLVLGPWPSLEPKKKRGKKKKENMKVIRECF